MILSVHAIFGAAVASLVPTHPVEAFTLGFASHFVLDVIPHRDYDLISLEYGSDGKIKPISLLEIMERKFKLVRDLCLISFDALLGLILAFMFFFNPIHPVIFLAGAIGSLIPDGMTFLFLIFKHHSLGLFYRVHSSFFHSKFVLKLNQMTGVIFQYFTITVLIAIIFTTKFLLDL